MVEAAIQISAPIQRIAPDTIRLERVLDASPETVWRYLTEAQLRETWFMGGTDASGVGEFDLLVDHDKLSTDDVPYPEENACYKGSVWHERCFGSNRRACSRRRSRAARTGSSPTN